MNRPVKNLHRYVEILRLREEGKTFQQIADQLKISRQRVWQIHERASQRIANTRNMSSHVLPTKRAA